MVELHLVHGLEADATAEPEDAPERDDPYFFEMSTASAEQVTIQIRTMLERSWEYIAIAYQGRAYLALGYRTWDEYVDDRLGDLRLTVPREERSHAVAALSNARMSLRAIAKVLGVGLGTVHRDLSSGSVGSGGAAGPKRPGPSAVEGRDGKEYPRRRTRPVLPCSICGDTHDEAPDECPWDLFAQGLGPRPEPAPPIPQAQDDLPREPRRPEPREVPDREPSRRAVAETVTRAVCIVDELAVLPDLVDEIEMALGMDALATPDTALVASVGELINQLQAQAQLFADLVGRLQRAFRIA